MPRPETSPYSWPLANVRWIHKMHMGPTAAAIETPMSRPRKKKLASISVFPPVYKHWLDSILTDKKVARPSRGLATFLSAFLAAERHVKQTKPPGGLVGLLLAYYMRKMFAY